MFKRQSQGFTLIEIMVVVMILGILATFIVPNIMQRPDDAKKIKARQDILAIEQALNLYRLDNHQYPTNDQGLSALVKKTTINPIPDNWKDEGYLRSLPIDPWGRPYHYLNPGIKNSRGIDIFSYGANGQPQGTGIDAVIGNWEDA